MFATAGQLFSTQVPSRFVPSKRNGARIPQTEGAWQDQSVIRVGPAGWAYNDWNGIVYPEPKPRGFDPLAYIANYFNTVEINSSFYGPPRADTAKKLIESVKSNSDFRFTAKLFQSFSFQFSFLLILVTVIKLDCPRKIDRASLAYDQLKHQM